MLVAIIVLATLMVVVVLSLCWWFYCLGGRNAYRDVVRQLEEAERVK